VLSIGVMKTAGWEYYAREVADGLEDYYSGAGEAPGVWTGHGAAVAGFSGTVTGDALALAFGDARHPVSGQRLGGGWRAEGVIGFDATFSAPKSVSLLFALGAAELRAEVRAAHITAVEEAGLGYLEEHAAFTRRGRNGVMVMDTDGLVIARFEHRTSRALDPQLHSHCLILNKVCDTSDGSWRALHGRPLFEEAKTAGMLYQAGLRAELSRRLGVAWGPVSEHGQAELAGIPQELLARFSTRSHEVEAAAEAKITELERALGRGLEADERGRVYRLAVLATRRPKTHDPVTEPSLYDRWADEAVEAGWEADAVIEVAFGPRRPGARLTPPDVVDTVVHGLCGERATFTRRDIVQAVTRHLDPAASAEAAAVRAHVEELTNTVLADPRVVSLRPAARVDPPTVLVRRDGDSVWDPPQAARYSTREMLTIEGRILHAAQIGRTADIGQVTPDVLERAIAAEPTLLGTDQHHALRAITSHGRRIEVVVGLAGSGKTTMLRVATRAWADAGYDVIGLSHTAVAADVLRNDADMPAETVAKFFHWHDHQPPPAGWTLTPRHVVVVDEAGMLATRDLDRLVTLASRQGAKVVLVGDHHQLGAIRAPGGMFAALAHSLEAIELQEVHRFTHPWEAHALAQLRRGETTGLDTLARERRIHGGPQPRVQGDCLTAWWDAQRAGRDAIMLAHDHATAHELARQARALRLIAREVQRDGLRIHTDVGAQTISVGDHIETRRNDRHLTYGPDQWVHNHDRWKVISVDRQRGTLEVEHLRHQARVALPADYVAHHVQLAYATTIAAAQGLTVDETHVVVTPRMYRSELYTALSRGRDANHAYAICDTDTDTDLAHRQAGRPPTPIEVLARVAQRERPDWAAHGVLRRSMSRAVHPDVILGRMVEVVRTLQRTPPGPDHDALEAYRQQLTAASRAVDRPPPPATTKPLPALRRSLYPEGPTIEL
jgi:conjugative relaxase-like TrwC/TraI family protein